MTRRVTLQEAIRHLQLGGGNVYVSILGERMGVLRMNEDKPMVRLDASSTRIPLSENDLLFIEDTLRTGFSAMLLELLNRSSTLTFKLDGEVMHVARNGQYIGTLYLGGRELIETPVFTDEEREFIKEMFRTVSA